ncbi:MAG: hypothetical protein GAK38_01504 [Xylophilus sp.]|nr:MAG: hypothetical protein GAK38_01504 [Xylophilus sp.]
MTTTRFLPFALALLAGAAAAQTPASFPATLAGHALLPA